MANENLEISLTPEMQLYDGIALGLVVIVGGLIGSALLLQRDRANFDRGAAHIQGWNRVRGVGDS